VFGINKLMKALSTLAQSVLALSATVDELNAGIRRAANLKGPAAAALPAPRRGRKADAAAATNGAE
jgi:hypothetical protein